MIDTFQRRDDGGLYEVVSETDNDVTLRAYDEGHAVSTVTRADFATHFDPTSRSLALGDVTADGAGGVRLACGEQVLHLTATQLSSINASAVP